MEDIRVGFIGTGRVSENYFRGISRCPSVRLIAISDANEEVGMTKARKWGVAFYKNPEEVFEREDIDAVFVLTPVDTHYYYTKGAILSGKHVLVEKPVSLNPGEIKELEFLAAEKGVVCMPGHSYLYLPELSRIVQAIKEGILGRPIFMFMSELYRMPLDLAKLYPHGPLVEILWHSLYLLLAFLGIPRRVVSFGSCLRKELEVLDHIVVSVEFNSGALAQILVSWVSEDETNDPFTFKLKVLGTDGGVDFSRKNLVSGIDKGSPPWRYPLYEEMFEKEISWFLDRCIRGGEAPLSSIKDAFHVALLLGAIRESIVSGKIVEV